MMIPISNELAVILVTTAGAVWVAYISKGKSTKSAKKTDKGASVHQEIMRPETEAERHSAIALEKIAASVATIERHIDIFLQLNKK